jgi:chromosomal replication initiation ATPase DnaA
MAQLAFNLPVTEAFRREDFYASPANAAALHAVQDPAVTRLLLVGPPGSGKTHLAHIWARAVGAEFIALSDLPDRIATLPTTARVVIDGADAAPRDETALFHLHNLLGAAGRLLLTATTPPRDWGLRLPDLLSRVQAMPMARLDPPDDALLSAVLVKLFADRQITVPPNLIAYLTTRMERSIAAARSLVAALDDQALADARPVSRALAAEVLDRSAPQ